MANPIQSHKLKQLYTQSEGITRSDFIQIVTRDYPTFEYERNAGTFRYRGIGRDGKFQWRFITPSELEMLAFHYKYFGPLPLPVE